MLNFFRQSNKLYSTVVAVLTLVILVLSVQQSFSQVESSMLSLEQAAVSDSELLSRLDSADHCAGTFIKVTINQQSDCCGNEGCDSSCPNIISFIAVVPDFAIDDSSITQIPLFYFEQRNNRVLLSELFRPPRSIFS